MKNWLYSAFVRTGAGCMAAGLVLLLALAAVGILVPVLWLFLQGPAWPWWTWIPSGLLAAAWLGWQAFGRSEPGESFPDWERVPSRRRTRARVRVVGPWAGHAIIHHRRAGGSRAFWSGQPVEIDMAIDDGDWPGDAQVARNYINNQCRELVRDVGVEVKK